MSNSRMCIGLDAYMKLKVIGKGSYGEVWLVQHRRDKKQYVFKRMNLSKSSERERKAAEQEAKLLAKLKHPNIVSYKDSFETPTRELYIVMGFCEGGDLYTRLKQQKGEPLEERQVVEWFVQIAMALQYMHERNILHRDLKTQNIFLTKSKIIKVGDLGIARVLDSSNDMATTHIGTPYYMSPELFSDRPYNHRSDVWALGCCVYEMATLKHAFNARDMNSLVYKILKGKMPSMPKIYSQELCNLIKAMLNHNPDKRPSVNRILRDPYIKKNIAMFLESTKKTRAPTAANAGRVAAIEKKASSNRANRGSPSPIPKAPAGGLAGQIGDKLEPLHVGPDLDPIREEPTPRVPRTPKSAVQSHDHLTNGGKPPTHSGSRPSTPSKSGERSPSAHHRSPKVSSSSPSRKASAAAAGSPSRRVSSSSPSHKLSAGSPASQRHRRRDSDDKSSQRYYSPSDRPLPPRPDSVDKPKQSSAMPVKSRLNRNSGVSESGYGSSSASSGNSQDDGNHDHSKQKGSNNGLREGNAGEKKKDVAETPRPMSARAKRREKREIMTPRISSSVDLNPSRRLRVKSDSTDNRPRTAGSRPHSARSGPPQVLKPQSGRRNKGKHVSRSVPNARDAVDGSLADELANLASDSKVSKVSRRSPPSSAKQKSNKSPRSSAGKRSDHSPPSSAVSRSVLVKQPSLPDDSSSSASDEEPSSDAYESKEDRRKNKEINHFISALDSTLRAGGNEQRKSDEVTPVSAGPTDDDDDDGQEDLGVMPVVVEQDEVIRGMNLREEDLMGEEDGIEEEEEEVDKEPEVAVDHVSLKQPQSRRYRDNNPGPVNTLGTSTRLAARIQLLRKDCVINLGYKKLMEAYNILNNVAGEGMEERLIELLGQTDFDLYAGKIWQLKFCEDAVFSIH